jgi:large subunit ribosomal protein L4e
VFMMTKVFDMTGKEKGEITLPKTFSIPVRSDLIKRAVLAEQANRRQAYGPNRMAGLRTSAHYHGVKDTRGSMKNKEMARLPRSHNTSGQQNMKARRVPQTAGGRRAHPPKPEKDWKQKINKKELKLAVCSAIAATTDNTLVVGRGHKYTGQLPIIVDDVFNDVKKVKDIKTFLLGMNLKDELERIGKRKVRAGRGKMRGRKYKTKKSILFVSTKDVKGVSNLSGCDFKTVKTLTVEDLAPGTMAGRLTIWTEGAVKKIGELHG